VRTVAGIYCMGLQIPNHVVPDCKSGTAGFFRQKLDYIHNNPVRAGIVDKAEEYRYSSARDFYGVKGLIELTDFE